MRKNLRKNRRDRSRGGKKRRVMYQQDFNLTSLGATRHSPRRGKQNWGLLPLCLPRLPDGNATRGKRGGVSKAKLKIQTISDSPLRNRRSLPEGGSRKAAAFKTAFRIRAAANRRICPAGPVSDPDSRFSCRGGKWKDNPL